MIHISYGILISLITGLWILIRFLCFQKKHSVNWKQEMKLILVYICIIVIARFTFFPFSKVNGQIQPLVFTTEQLLPLRINLCPFIYLFDYPTVREILLNLIGNTTMFIPVGIVWPFVFKDLNTHKKAIFAGVGFSLCIEVLQLPFFDRVSDIDDLIMNSTGYLIGYGIYLLCRRKR